MRRRKVSWTANCDGVYCEQRDGVEISYLLNIITPLWIYVNLKRQNFMFILIKRTYLNVYLVFLFQIWHYSFFRIRINIAGFILYTDYFSFVSLIGFHQPTIQIIINGGLPSLYILIYVLFFVSKSHNVHCLITIKDIVQNFMHCSPRL